MRIAYLYDQNNLIHGGEKMIKKKIITSIIAMAMFCMMSISAFAIGDDYYNVQISLPENQVWTESMSMERSGYFSFAWASLESVYPLSGTDNFKKIQARIVNSSGSSIMDSSYVVLEEGKDGERLYIKEGCLNLTTIYIQFRGNTSKAAEAVVSYGGN